MFVFRFIYWVLICVFLSSTTALAKTVRYELVASRQLVNLSGKQSVDFALSLNGQIPAPTLVFTEGDEAEVTVVNKIENQEVSIHWHGILLPTEMDGVPYVTTPPIKSGSSFTFKFKIRQNGTYWYHSHTGLQEQKGVYGAIVIHPQKTQMAVDKDLVVVLSDWSDENPDNILKNLKKDGDYYLYKKGTIRSWWGAIQQGSLGNFLYNEWTRMGGMDLSDVGYDSFLMNGKQDSQLLTAHPGEKIRIRVINAAASSYFYLSLSGLAMRVIASDGIDITPIEAKEILIGMAETYDLLFTVPEHNNYELRAMAQDGTGWASGWIGIGDKKTAPTRAKPDQYATMDHSSHSDSHVEMNHESMLDEHQMHHQHSMTLESVTQNAKITKVETLTVDDLSAKESTFFPNSSPVKEVKLVLGGNMSRYTWYINGKSIHQDRTIEINENDVIKFTFVNETMMHHPMHLHGHFFRVLNKYEEKSPLKHTVDVPSHQSRTIEFMANEPGEWMLHCHNLYHLKSGMARVVKYSSYKPRAELVQWQKQDPHNHDHLYYYGLLEASTNHMQLYFQTSQAWNQFETRIESANIHGKQLSFNDEWDYEVDLFYRRWVNRFFNFIVGGTSYGEQNHAVVGVGYVLPMIIKTNLIINHEGKLRFDLEKKFQWTKYFYSEVNFTWRPQQQTGAHETELEVSLMYSPVWSLATGLMFTNDSLGAGLEYQF